MPQKFKYYGSDRPCMMILELGDPWDYSVTKGVMVLRGKGCTMDFSSHPDPAFGVPELNAFGVIRERRLMYTAA